MMDTKLFFKNFFQKIRQLVSEKKSFIVYLCIFLLTTLPFFVAQLIFIYKNTANIIFADKITFLSESLDGIMNNSLNVKDYFTLHDGFFSPGSYIILSFEIKVIGLNNDYILSLIVPFILLFIIAIIWLCRLSKTDKICFKQVVLTSIFGVLSSLFIFSLYSWDIIWYSFGITIFISCFLYIISMFLFKKSVDNEKKCLIYLIISTFVGSLTILMFGSFHAIAFSLSMAIISCILFANNFKNKMKSRFFYLGSLIIYFVLFLVILIVKVSNANHKQATAAGFNLVSAIEMYFYTLSYSFAGPISGVFSLYGHYLFGLIVLSLSAFALYIYIKKQYHKQNIFILFMFLFSELTIISVIFGKVATEGPLSGGVSYFYPAYMFLPLFVVGILIPYLNEKINKSVSFSQAVILTVVSFLTIGVFIRQVDYVIKENNNSKKQFENQLIYESFLYEGRDDDYLASVYQTDGKNVRNCFDLLNKYSLIDNSLINRFSDQINDSFQNASMTSGLYDKGQEGRFTSKVTIIYFKVLSDCQYSVSFYNPINFDDNSFSIFVNDELVYENIDLKTDELKVQTINLKAGINKLKVELDHTICPKEIGISGDIRNLGFVMKMTYIENDNN